MTISLKLKPEVDLAWKIRDEQDQETALELTVQLLRTENGFRDSTIASVYPYIGSIRETLLQVATDERWNNDGLGYRARELLAYWGDERDENILNQWFDETAEKRRKLVFVEDFSACKPDIEAGETLEEAISNWKKATGRENRLIQSVKVTTPNRALVRHSERVVAWEHYFDMVFVKRGGKWKVLFYLPTDSVHMNYQWE